MSFGISTLKRTICTLLVGAVLLVGMALPAEAQRRGRDGRWWDGRRDNGRHLGWTRGRHLGWRNRRWNDDHRRRREWRRDWRDDRRDFRRSRRSQRRLWRQSSSRQRYFGQPVRVVNRRWYR